MKKLLLVFCFVLLLSGSATAHPVTLTNIGTVDLPPNAIVTSDKIPEKESMIANVTIVRLKDGAAWRSMAIIKYLPFAPDEQDKQKTMKFFWELLFEAPESETPDPYTISVEPAQKLKLNGKDCVNASFKWDNVGVGIVLHREAFMVSEPDGMALFIFMCADSDLPYWHPFMLKIAGATSSKGALL